MPVRLLLTRDVEHLGGRGEIVSVTGGYARNFLLPRRLAVPVTPGISRYAAQLVRQGERQREERRVQEGELAARLSQVSCTLVRKAGEDEKLFGSVSAADIAEALRAQGFEVDRRQVLLEEPLKALGVFTVSVRVSAEHETSIKVWVVREAGTP